MIVSIQRIDVIPYDSEYSYAIAFTITEYGVPVYQNTVLVEYLDIVKIHAYALDLYKEHLNQKAYIDRLNEELKVM